ncbi:MAG: M3 family metallopeptidase [Halorhodospira sp.]
MPENPLLSDHPLPPFSKIQAEHVLPAVDALIESGRQTLESALATGPPHTWEHLMQPLEEADDRLARAWAPISHLHAVADNPELRKAYNAALPKLSAYYAELAQDQRLYQALAELAERAPALGLDTAQRKVVNDALQELELAGVGLEEPARSRFRANAQRLSELAARFQQNLLDATQAWTRQASEAELTGLPESALAMARQAAADAGIGGYRLTLQMPSVLAVLQHAEDRGLREEVYTAHATRASELGPHGGQFDNTPIIEEILRLRVEQAELLGYPTFADKALVQRMADSPGQVHEFLTDLAERARPQALAEMDELRRFAYERDGLDYLEVWDVPFYSERLKEERFQLSAETLRPYFPAEHVVEGLFTIAERLFGVRFRLRNEVDTWHPDVRYYELIDTQGTARGGLYADLYARSGKRGGAWMGECRSRRWRENGVQRPVAFLTCNFTPTAEGAPALLTHEEVVTLFHEFGHTLHHLLTQQDWRPIAGIHGVEWDAVELPSQLLENWCWEREGLKLIAAHYETGEPLPRNLYDRLRASRDFHIGLQMVRQLELALFDLELHQCIEAPDAAGIHAILEDIRHRIAVVHPPDWQRFPQSFAHIFAGGYAAGYYSYKWAEVLSADAFERFREEGLLERSVGQALAKHILEMGGSEPARELFQRFRGRAPSIGPLLRQSGLTDSDEDGSTSPSGPHGRG